MNDEFPPFSIPAPRVAERRKEQPRRVPITPERLQRRQEIAQRLIDQITPLSQSLHQISDEERQAIFYKLEHELPIDLVGTDLKPIAEHSERFTLAVPKADTLEKFVNKIDNFGKGEIKNGHVPNELLATRILNIVLGDPKDRLSQALFEQYDQLIRQTWVICEIEIISLATGSQARRRELQHIREILQQAFASGMYGNFFEQEETAGTCRAVIRCSGQMFKTLVEGREWQTRISWFDARPKFETLHTILKHFSVDALGAINPPPESAPVVCIIDSGVTIGNPFLRTASKDELLKSFLGRAPDQPYDEFGHGSGVASLAAYYALNLDQGATNNAKVWIASARVLNANNEVEEERLFSKIIAEVVEHFVPLGVRIYNLSINVINRKWNAEAKRTVPRTSWIARTIDHLSREKDVVFVISTGNIPRDEIRSYLTNDKPYPAYFTEEEAVLLDPAQAALALTVGTVAPGTLLVGPSGQASAIAARNQPSPFTRCGPGISGEVKPELVDYGGNYAYDIDGGQVRSNPGTDVMMASHQLTPAISHESGSSFAAPRISHKLAMILADLRHIGLGQISSPLLKAFLVNSAKRDRLGGEFQEFCNTLDAVKLNHWINIVGYGLPDAGFATDCDRFSALLYYQGILDPDHVAYFEIPVPRALIGSGDGIKRLTVTLVHAPEVQRWGIERYLGTSMKWRMFRGDVVRDEIIAAMSVEDGAGDGDAQPERPNEMHGMLGVNLRSKGCVQHDIIEWNRHQEHYSDATYTLAVAAYKKWTRSVDPIPYAIVVRLEDTTRTTQVYSEVRNILNQIQVRA